MNVYEQMWKVLEARAARTNNTVVLDAMCKNKQGVRRRITPELFTKIPGDG